MTWITCNIPYNVCPNCGSEHTESKGKRFLSNAVDANKRVCHRCKQYYYWKDIPNYEVFYQDV